MADDEQDKRRRLTLDDMDRARRFAEAITGFKPEPEPVSRVYRPRMEVWGRRSGKTTAAVKWLREETDEDRILLVKSESMATTLRNLNRLSARQVMSFRAFFQRTRGRAPVVWVEDGNALMRWMLNQVYPGISFDRIMMEDEREHGHDDPT